MVVSKLETVISFPPGTFLENIAVRHDQSFLLTAHTNSQIFYVSPGASPEAVLLHQFEHNCLGIVETKHDVFYISTSTPEIANSSSLWCLDMNGWSRSLSSSFKLTKVLDLPSEAKWLNGSGLLSAEKQVILLADSFGGQIWRVDLGPTPSAKVWLADAETMFHDPEGPYKEAPGVNGVHFNEKDEYVYWTNSIKALFCRVKVDADSLQPVGEIEVVAQNVLVGDDFIIDSDKAGAYITTHAYNGIDWVSFDGKQQETVAGQPFDERLLGTTAAAWSRKEGDKGKVFYVTTEGGMVIPHEGKVREARLLRIEV